MAVAAFRQVLAHGPIRHLMSSKTAGPPTRHRRDRPSPRFASSKIVNSGYPRTAIYAEEGENQLMIAAEMRRDWRD
jgi:hypothetical protein